MPGIIEAQESRDYTRETESSSSDDEAQRPLHSTGFDDSFGPSRIHKRWQRQRSRGKRRRTPTAFCARAQKMMRRHGWTPGAALGKPGRRGVSSFDLLFPALPDSRDGWGTGVRGCGGGGPRGGIGFKAPSRKSKRLAAKVNDKRVPGETIGTVFDEAQTPAAAPA